MRRIKLILIAAATTGFAIACTQQTANNAVTGNNQPSAPAKVETTPSKPADSSFAGKELYATNCMICHKDTGKGGKLTLEGKTIDPDDLTTAKMAEKPDEKLYQYVSEGFPDDGMPAFKDKLKEAEIRAVVSFVRTLQGK